MMTKTALMLLIGVVLVTASLALPLASDSGTRPFGNQGAGHLDIGHGQPPCSANMATLCALKISNVPAPGHNARLVEPSPVGDRGGMACPMPVFHA